MRPVVLAALLLLPAGCVHARHDVHDPDRQVVEVERVVEAPAPEPEARPLPRPDASYARIARFDRRPQPGGDVVEIAIPDGGMGYGELFALVARETGLRIRYEPYNAVVKSKKLEIVGPVRVPRDDLFAWFQDACFVDGLVAVPYGPSDRREVVVLDQANANLTQHPDFVPEDALPELTGRTGLYVASVLTLPEGMDPARARQALSQYSTKTAGLGRINDIPDARALVVGDFASIVATMRRVLDELAIRQYEAQGR